jgi:hypothetical protein
LSDLVSFILFAEWKREKNNFYFFNTTPSMTSAAERLRAALAKYDWSTECLDKVAQLRAKYAQPTKDRTKGAGGSVSAVRRAQSYAQTCATLLRAAVGPCGHALIHGSVSLTSKLESDRDSISKLVQENDAEFFNVQQVPFVNLDHNITIKAYQGWQDTRHSLALENIMLEDARQEALAAGRTNFAMNKREESYFKSLLKVRQRSAMRAGCLTTLRLRFTGSEAKIADSVRRYGSDQIVLCVITYRKMPPDVQAEINERKITEQQVIDVVVNARKRYEAYFASYDGIYNCERCMRTVPAGSTYDYFDQMTYFERTVMPRLREAVEKQLHGGDAVRHVFPIERDGDENQCQRAFGCWLLNELGKMFGSDFEKEYKEVIAGHGADQDIQGVFKDLLNELEVVLAEFSSAIEEVIPSTRVIVTKRARVAEAAMAPKASGNAFEDDDGDGDDDEPSGPDVSHADIDASGPSVLRLGLAKHQQRTRLQVESESLARARKNSTATLDDVVAASNLPLPNASLWPMPFKSSIPSVPIVKSRAEVTAASDIVRRLGVCDELERKTLRRTMLEVSAGDNLVQTATNATTASVRAGADGDDGGMRDVGVDSRRMRNESSTKEIPLDALIQHINPATGTLASLRVTNCEIARYRAKNFDPDTVPVDADEIEQMALGPEDTVNRIRFLRGVHDYPTELYYKVCQALIQARVPARADSETQYAIVKSRVTLDACTEFVEKMCASYIRMLDWESSRNKTSSP